MSSSHYAPRCQLNKNDFSCRRNSPMSLSGWRILACRLFQSRGPAAAWNWNKTTVDGRLKRSPDRRQFCFISVFSARQHIAYTAYSTYA